MAHNGVHQCDRLQQFKDTSHCLPMQHTRCLMMCPLAMKVMRLLIGRGSVLLLSTSPDQKNELSRIPEKKG
eukprot:2483014-Amphidinium_carterae.1